MFLYIKIFAGYYQKIKESAQKIARKGYQDLSEEEKNRKHQYGCERYKNLPESKKQKLVEFKKDKKIKTAWFFYQDNRSLYKPKKFKNIKNFVSTKEFMNFFVGCARVLHRIKKIIFFISWVSSWNVTKH